MCRACAGPSLFAGVLALLLLPPSQALAADPDTVALSPDWRRVNVAEAVATIALTAADTEIDAQIPYPSHADWHGGILFDNWARNVFRGRTLSAQQTASDASDLIYKVGSFVPLVVDDYFATLSAHQNADLALQMLFIDLEAFSVSGLVSLTAEHAVGRARPYTEHCGLRDSSGNLLHQCGTANDARSFYSGHATATATSAGLVCVTHQHLPLFGGGFADLAPCLFMIGMSITTGVLRLVYDAHWASDVVTGWMVGAACGYLLPAALHYGFGRKRPPGEIVAGDLHALPARRRRPRRSRRAPLRPGSRPRLHAGRARATGRRRRTLKHAVRTALRCAALAM